jgi:hypothetical protein
MPAQMWSRVTAFFGLCIAWNVASVPASSDRRTQSPASKRSAASRIFSLRLPLLTTATARPRSLR